MFIFRYVRCTYHHVLQFYFVGGCCDDDVWDTRHVGQVEVPVMSGTVVTDHTGTIQAHADW